MQTLTDFELLDSESKPVRLSSLWQQGPVLFVFYPGDYTPVCTAQLCDYRDNYNQFEALGVTIVGISQDAPERHVAFAKEHKLPFALLADTQNAVIRSWGLTSKWSLGLPSRAVCLVTSDGKMAWKHVEMLAITRRRADQLVEEISPILRRLSLKPA